MVEKYSSVLVVSFHNSFQSETMSRLTILCLLLVLALTAEAAIRCTDDVCSKLVCHGEQTKDACHAKGVTGRYKFIEKGGSCGCCHNCVRVLNENEICAETFKIGGPPSAVCGDTLDCHAERRICIKKA